MAFHYIRWQKFPARYKKISCEDILLKFPGSAIYPAVLSIVIPIHRLHRGLKIFLSVTYPAAFSFPRFIHNIPEDTAGFKHSQVVVRSLVGVKELAIKTKIVCYQDIHLTGGVGRFGWGGGNDDTRTTNTSCTHLTRDRTSVSRAEGRLGIRVGLIVEQFGMLYAWSGNKNIDILPALGVYITRGHLHTSASDLTHVSCMKYTMPNWLIMH